MEVADALAAFKPLIAVHGNIDGGAVRAAYTQMQRVNCEEVDILITHIGGYPGRYDRSIFPILKAHPPTLFIAGHSHILKVMHDHAMKFLHINPGAAGNSGIHQVKTAVRLTIDGAVMKNLEVFELQRRHI
jgi:predicted phosphodiesterase